MNHSEIFLHTQNCLDDFNDARNVLRAVKQSSNELLRNAAFKYAVIAYCRAYTSSKGSQGGSMVLDKKYIPADFHDCTKNYLVADIKFMLTRIEIFLKPNYKFLR